MTALSSDNHHEMTLVSLGLDAELLATRSAVCKAEPVSHPDVHAVVYRNALSPEECSRILATLQHTPGWFNKNSKKHVRDAEGLPFPPSPELAQLLQSRLGLPHTLPLSWSERVVRRGDKHLGDIGTEGTWAPLRLNERLRPARYRAGGHFAPHRDGVIQPCDGERSFATLLLYLTGSGLEEGGGFDGGETAFIRDNHDLEYGQFDQNNDVIARVVPEPGLALLFWQDQLHAGLPVQTAEGDDEPRKFIFVSELFYERVAPPAEGDGWASSSVALLREAEAHENAGEYADAIRCYNRLRRLDPELACHAGIP